MGRCRRSLTCPMLVLTAACGASRSAGTTTTETPRPTRTTVTGSLSVAVTAGPDHVFVGTDVTFTVEIRGPGTGDSEDVRFGDGATSGANAGMIWCGDTARADRAGTYGHSYASPGTYVFGDAVDAIGPPPARAREDATGTVTVIVASPMQTTSGGVVRSPTGNIACGTHNCTDIAPPEVHGGRPLPLPVRDGRHDLHRHRRRGMHHLPLGRRTDRRMRWERCVESPWCWSALRPTGCSLSPVAPARPRGTSTAASR